MQVLMTLQQQILRCTRCPRLVEYRTRVAREKRRQYRQEEYWGKPLPSFGDPQARLLIIGLAPAAHGGNRTGRMFTGDQSGDWVYRTLHLFGFANQPISQHRGDGLTLHDAYITAAARCVPPDNKPSVAELAVCRPYLLRELELLRRVRVVVPLGKIAFDAFLAARRARWGCHCRTCVPILGMTVSRRFRMACFCWPPTIRAGRTRKPVVSPRPCSRPSSHAYARNWTGASPSLNRRERRSVLHLDFSPRTPYSSGSSYRVPPLPLSSAPNTDYACSSART